MSKVRLMKTLVKKMFGGDDLNRIEKAYVRRNPAEYKKALTDDWKNFDDSVGEIGGDPLNKISDPGHYQQAGYRSDTEMHWDSKLFRDSGPKIGRGTKMSGAQTDDMARQLQRDQPGAFNSPDFQAQYPDLASRGNVLGDVSEIEKLRKLKRVAEQTGDPKLAEAASRQAARVAQTPKGSYKDIEGILGFEDTNTMYTMIDRMNHTGLTREMNDAVERLAKKAVEKSNGRFTSVTDILRAITN